MVLRQWFKGGKMSKEQVKILGEILTVSQAILAAIQEGKGVDAIDPAPETPVAGVAAAPAATTTPSALPEALPAIPAAPMGAPQTSGLIQAQPLAPAQRPVSQVPNVCHLMAQGWVNSMAEKNVFAQGADTTALQQSISAELGKYVGEQNIASFLTIPPAQGSVVGTENLDATAANNLFTQLHQQLSQIVYNQFRNICNPAVFNYKNQPAQPQQVQGQVLQQ